MVFINIKKTRPLITLHINNMKLKECKNVIELGLKINNHLIPKGH